MFTISCIKRFVSLSGPREIFTTRDLLNYGSRNAVDQAMHRMVKAGYVIRLARGVFVRADDKTECFTAFEIAKVKAESFGRQIITHAKDIAYKLKILPEGNKEITYATDGASSSFAFGDIRIYFKKTSLKNMCLGETRVGQAIRALNYIGKNFCGDSAVRAAIQELWREQPLKVQLKKSNAFMPSWLVSHFTWFREDIAKWPGKEHHRPLQTLSEPAYYQIR
jgi:hypothetical protein